MRTKEELFKFAEDICRRHFEAITKTSYHIKSLNFGALMVVSEYYNDQVDDYEFFVLVDLIVELVGYVFQSKRKGKPIEAEVISKIFKGFELSDNQDYYMYIRALEGEGNGY